MKAWLCLLSAGVIYSKDMSVSTSCESGQWVDISSKVIQSLVREGKKIGYPGKNGGIATDRITGDVFMVIPDQGIWRSSDHRNSFTRVDGDKIGGRCETGFSLNFDPLGKRLACFMLDALSGYTLDGGKTWQPMKANQRGWDAGSVQWSGDKAANIFALRHECGGDSWTKVCRLCIPCLSRIANVRTITATLFALMQAARRFPRPCWQLRRAAG